MSLTYILPYYAQTLYCIKKHILGDSIFVEWDHLSYIIYSMVADDLQTQGTKASSAMVLTWIYQLISL